MRDLLLKLLTYEPFEKIKDVEKDYIDFVVLEDEVRVIRPSYRIYYELLIIFEKIVNSEGKNIAGLKEWLDRYFEKAGGHLVYCSNGKRAYYPVLFKKICFFCLTEFKGMTDKNFFEQMGLRSDFLLKNGVSSEYRRCINCNTYHKLKMYRRGQKAKYLVMPIKAAYYEASRQYRETEESLPKKTDLLPFYDCFAGTGVVSASVDANKIFANDSDICVAAFLYAMSHDFRMVRKCLVDLHNGFMKYDYDKDRKFYTDKKWEDHKERYDQYKISNPIYNEWMKKSRNNYHCMKKAYDGAVKKAKSSNYVPDFDTKDKKTIHSFYYIGVVWYFVNVLKPKKGVNEFAVSTMDQDAYYDYMKDTLGVKFSGNITSDTNYKLIKKQLKKSDVKFADGRAFMKALHGATITSMDFRIFLRKRKKSDFVYLDSPYFLTSGYSVGFNDKDHITMIYLLRKAKYKWLFSMQYKKADYMGGDKKKLVSERKSHQKKSDPIIRSYGDYFKGFVKDFAVEVDESEIPPEKINDENERKKHQKLVVNDPVDSGNENSTEFESENPLFAIFFKKTKTGEMMICNFDVRRVLPYGGDVVVMPYSLFLDSLTDSKTGLCREYAELIKIAEEHRKKDIIEHYAEGCLV